MQLNYSDFLTWILSQPPTRPLDMSQSIIRTPESCGCLLAQYGRDELHFPLPIATSFEAIRSCESSTPTTFDRPFFVDRFISAMLTLNPITFGQVQDYIKQHNIQ